MPQSLWANAEYRYDIQALRSNKKKKKSQTLVLFFISFSCFTTLFILNFLQSLSSS